MADINEQICKAVDIIVSKKLESVNFDSTIIATIVDNSEAGQYKYICSNGSSQFIAYAKETNYKINESVYVTIPNNDYDQQKIIIGKYVAKDAKPYVFKQPFETIIDLSGNLIQTNNTIANGLLANNISNIEYCENLNRNEILERLSEKTDNQINKDQINKELNIDILKLLLQFIEDGELNQNFENVFNSEQSAEEQEKIIEQLLNRDNILEQLYEKTNNLINEEQINKNTNTFHLAALLQAIRDNRLIGDYGDIFNSEQTAEEQEKIIEDLLQVYESVLLWEQNFEEGYTGFDRLGLQAQFRSWISAYNAVTGDYGLKLFLYSDMGKTIEIDKDKDKDKEENFLDTLKITEIKFGSQDMYGNPYNFQSFIEQESVFDISNLGNIYRMELYFYQAPNTFKDKDRNLIPYKDIFGNRLLNNLFVKDPYICLGYNLSDFTGEQVILSTLDPKDYIIDDNIPPSDISKYIRLRWVHKFENGDIQVVNEDSKLDYEIRWYRYELGIQSADEYSGVYWEKVDDGNNNPFDYTLIPRKKHNEELIKAIVLYDGKSYTSNILTFTNQRETINDATVDFINGLSIVCEDNSYGNYCIYGQNNNLFDADQANRIRELQAYFGFSEQGQTSDKLQEATKIVWEFPLYNSMIILDGFDYYKKPKPGPLDGYYTDSTVITNVEQGIIQIIRRPDEKGQINSKQDYRIYKTYSQSKINNTIKCTITKNEIEYSATKDFTFGLMGTNGTDATVVIDFDDNKVALTADTPVDEETGNDLGEALSLTAHLYDFTHKEVDFKNKDLNLSCEWSWFYYNVGYGESVNIKPVFRTDSNGKQISINRCFLEHKKLDLNNQFLVLQATIKGWGDYDLTSYKAIPIRKNKQYRNYIGPTDIIYSSSGYANYYKQPFELWWCENISNINDNDSVLDRTLTIKAENLIWKIGNPYNADERYIGTINNNILKPLYMYIRETDPYSIVCFQNNEIVWIQPLVIIQNEYPSTTINKWDGKEISMKEGLILTPAVAAGRKDDFNRFYGVMIGDWSSTDTESDISQQTGVYGFHEGIMSYAFKDDGTAFIGKAQKGRIEFNGNEGIIKSALWTDKNPIGMKIDLDNGALQMSSDKNYKSISNPIGEDFGTYYIEIEYKPVELNSTYNQNQTYYKPIRFSDNHRGSAINSQYFYEKVIDAEGKVSYKKLTTFDSNKIGTYSFPIEFEQEIFYETPENISDYYVSIDSYYILAQYKEESQSGLGLNFNSNDFTYYIPGEKGYITLSADEETYPLGIGLSSSIYSRNFRVKWDGTCYINNGIFQGIVTADELYCSNGEIGGWKIGRYTLSGGGGQIVLDSSDASITGGILRSPSGGIILDGYFTLLNGAYIGEMKANFGTDIDQGTSGVGFQFGLASVKATNMNVGMSNEMGVLTLSNHNNNITLAAKKNGRILIFSRDTGDIQIGVMAKTNPINIYGDTVTIDAKKIIFKTPKPEDQTGIYARFAE